MGLVDLVAQAPHATLAGFPGYLAVLIVGVLAGFTLGRRWDYVIDWLFEAGSILWHWFEVALLAVGVCFAFYAALHWWLHVV